MVASKIESVRATQVKRDSNSIGTSVRDKCVNERSNLTLIENKSMISLMLSCL
jgi:hypothetical protein